MGLQIFVGYYRAAAGSMEGTRGATLVLKVGLEGSSGYEFSAIVCTRYWDFQTLIVMSIDDGLIATTLMAVFTLDLSQSADRINVYLYIFPG